MPYYTFSHLESTDALLNLSIVQGCYPIPQEYVILDCVTEYSRTTKHIYLASYISIKDLIVQFHFQIAFTEWMEFCVKMQGCKIEVHMHLDCALKNYQTLEG